jgi:cytochrome oxidase assembly protein ShyY1
LVVALRVRTAFLSAQPPPAAPAGSLWNSDCRIMTPADTQLTLALAVYGLAAASTFVIGYLAWRRIRPHRHRYHYHQVQDGRQKGLSGWE